jgi:cytochrome c-type protein NapB
MKKVILAAFVAGSITSAFAGYNLPVCKGCHGQNFEKKAMNQSLIVKDMSKEEIIASLKGYKDGSYGRNMANLMKPQVANLTDEDIAAIADEIKQ